MIRKLKDAFSTDRKAVLEAMRKCKDGPENAKVNEQHDKIEKLYKEDLKYLQLKKDYISFSILCYSKEN